MGQQEELPLSIVQEVVSFHKVLCSALIYVTDSVSKLLKLFIRNADS